MKLKNLCKIPHGVFHTCLCYNFQITNKFTVWSCIITLKINSNLYRKIKSLVINNPLLLSNSSHQTVRGSTFPGRHIHKVQIHMTGNVEFTYSKERVFHVKTRPESSCTQKFKIKVFVIIYVVKVCIQKLVKSNKTTLECTQCY